MTLIVFLVDDSPSMNQIAYNGISFINFAKQIIETFYKQRQRDGSASNVDRYMLMTFEDYPFNVKCGWKEGQRQFQEQIKLLRCRGRSRSRLDVAIGSVLRFLNTNRMPYVDQREYYGYGRYITNSEYAIIVSIVDGSTLLSASSQPTITIPKHKTVGSDMTVEAFRWDQRHFSIVLRMSSIPPVDDNLNTVPPPDDSIAELLCAQMGGRSFELRNHRLMGICIETILQKILLNGVMVRLSHIGPDPPIPQDAPNKEELFALQDSGDQSWRAQLLLVKSRLGNTSKWPVPEAYWPDSVRPFRNANAEHALPARSAHPQLYFRCQDIEPIPDKQLLPFDSFELDRTALTALVLARKGNACWPVFMAGSGREGEDLPFGYIKASASLQSIGLFISAYNFPVLFPLLKEATTNKKVCEQPAFIERFIAYLRSVPSYYYPELRKHLQKLGITAMKDVDEALGRRPYRGIELSSLIQKIREQGKLDFEKACSDVDKNNKAEQLAQSRPQKFVKVSKYRSLLGYPAVDECRHRPALNAYRHQIVDLYKDLPVFIELEAEPRPVKPSELFKNPFDIPRENLLTQLAKMRINFEQTLQPNGPHLFQGGMPGTRIRLQQAEDLAAQPIQRMGAYEDYMKRLQEIGLGPKRPVDDLDKPKPHAFGNPFKLDKKSMSLIDEVGEMNVMASSTPNGNEVTDKRKSKSQQNQQPQMNGETTPIPKMKHRRKPGPIDSRHALAWRRRFSSSSYAGSESGAGSLIGDDLSDTGSIASGISDISDLSSIAGDGGKKSPLGERKLDGVNRFSPIRADRKRPFSNENEQDEDEEYDDEEKPDLVVIDDDAEYRSSEDDETDRGPISSIPIMEPDDEALLRGAHFAPSSSSSMMTPTTSSSSFYPQAMTTSTAFSVDSETSSGISRKKPPIGAKKLKRVELEEDDEEEEEISLPIPAFKPPPAKKAKKQKDKTGATSSASLFEPEDIIVLGPSTSKKAGPKSDEQAEKPNKKGGGKSPSEKVPKLTTSKNDIAVTKEGSKKKKPSTEGKKSPMAATMTNEKSELEEKSSASSTSSSDTTLPFWAVGKTLTKKKSTEGGEKLLQNGTAVPGHYHLPQIEFPPPQSVVTVSGTGTGQRPSFDPQLLEACQSIQRVVRQFTTSANIFDRCVHLISGSPIGQRRELLALAIRDAQRMRRPELAEQLERLLLVNTPTPTTNGNGGETNNGTR